MDGTTDTNPRYRIPTFVRNLRHDAVSGFLVFLIALPLCLAISLASGFPAIAGIFTAIVGAVVATAISNSELTIKGPAAGLIVIVLGTVNEFSQLYDPSRAYRLTLGVAMAAGIVQILFALFRTGVVGDFFPTAAVHGMLAAIGLIIIGKQIPICLGLPNKGEPLELLVKIPSEIASMNPEIAVIGGISLLILFGLPLIRSKALRLLPAQMVVVLVAVPLSMYFDLDHTHTYSFGGQEYKLGPQYLVDVPNNLLGAMTAPDFEGLKTATGWKWVLMFALVGTLESMLSAKAIDLLDPWRRKTNMDRDNLAIGVGNTLAACIGGLPMISEIVRSRANIDNGARTRYSNMFHGIYLLLFVALVPQLLHRIPLAALGAMLVYTGFRLASPREFINVYRIGREQLVIFLGTMVAVLATDLLIGIAVGIAIKIAIHMMHGATLWSLFRPSLEIQVRDGNSVYIKARQSLVFSNWISFRRQIENAGLLPRRNVTIDLSETKLVDHSVMEKLHELQHDFEQNLLELEIVGLDAHRMTSKHPMSTRRRQLAPIRRITVVADNSLEKRLVQRFAELGATGYTVIECAGAGRRRLREAPTSPESRIRLEVLATPEVAERMLTYLYREVAPDFPVTACVETVQVLDVDEFTSMADDITAAPSDATAESLPELVT